MESWVWRESTPPHFILLSGTYHVGYQLFIHAYKWYTHMFLYTHVCSLYLLILPLLSVQFSSVSQSCPTLCNAINHSMPGLPVHHQFLEFTRTQVHRVGDAIQPSHPLSSPSPPAPSPSQHQGFFLTKLSISKWKSLQVWVLLLCSGSCKEVLRLCGAQGEERGRAWAILVNLGKWDFRFYSQVWQDIVGFWIGE